MQVLIILSALSYLGLFVLILYWRYKDLWMTFAYIVLVTPKKKLDSVKINTVHFIEIGLLTYHINF